MLLTGYPEVWMNESRSFGGSGPVEKSPNVKRSRRCGNLKHSRFVALMINSQLVTSRDKDWKDFNCHLVKRVAHAWMHRCLCNWRQTVSVSFCTLSPPHPLPTLYKGLRLMCADIPSPPLHLQHPNSNWTEGEVGHQHGIFVWKSGEGGSPHATIVPARHFVPQHRHGAKTAAVTRMNVMSVHRLTHGGHFLPVWFDCGSAPAGVKAVSLRQAHLFHVSPSSPAKYLRTAMWASHCRIIDQAWFMFDSSVVF